MLYPILSPIKTETGIVTEGEVDIANDNEAAELQALGVIGEVIPANKGKAK